GVRALRPPRRSPSTSHPFAHCSITSPVSMSRTATCCFRVCKSQPTRIMSSAAMPMTSCAPASPRLSTTRCGSHDINSGPSPTVARAAVPAHRGRLVLADRPVTPAARRLQAALAAVLVVAAAALVDAQARTVEIVVGKTTKAEIVWAYGTPEDMSNRSYIYSL